MPDDLAAVHDMILRLSAARAEKTEAITRRDVEVVRLTAIIKKLQRSSFGQKSAKLDPDQLALGLEDLQAATAIAYAEVERLDATLEASCTEGRHIKRERLPDHLPRVEVVLDIQDKICPCCARMLHVIGEDRSERLDVIPAQHRVLVTRRPKYACRSCADGVVQSHAPGRLIEGGLPTEAMIAHVLVGKYADH